MERIKTILLVFVLSVMFFGCGKNSDEIAIGYEDETSITISTNSPETVTDTTVSEDLPETEDVAAELISSEKAIEAIKKYCCEKNPDLERIAADEYPVYWEIISSDDKEIVILFRSYTGAQVRYYINCATGITNITEFVPGITDEEEATGETFNIRDYIV